MHRQAPTQLSFVMSSRPANRGTCAVLTQSCGSSRHCGFESHEARRQGGAGRPVEAIAMAAQENQESEVRPLSSDRRVSAEELCDLS